MPVPKPTPNPNPTGTPEVCTGAPPPITDRHRHFGRHGRFQLALAAAATEALLEHFGKDDRVLVSTGADGLRPLIAETTALLLRSTRISSAGRNLARPANASER